jgi:hypothetical protein
LSVSVYGPDNSIKINKIVCRLNNRQRFKDDTKRCLMENLIPTNVPSPEEYVLEADGKIKLEHANFTQALKAGFELKQKFPLMQIKVHNENE